MPELSKSFTHPAVIETERLILKGIDPPLFHQLFELLTEEEFVQYLGLTENEFDHHRQMHEKGIETYRLSLFYFILIDRISGKTIGDCGFHTWNPYHHRAELFYNIRNEQYRKQGLMKEALKVVLQYGFERLNLHRIAALADAMNEPSVKLIKHFGFQFEGVMREDYLVDGKNEDSVCYSLLKHEWEKQFENGLTDDFL